MHSRRAYSHCQIFGHGAPMQISGRVVFMCRTARCLLCIVFAISAGNRVAATKNIATEIGGKDKVPKEENYSSSGLNAFFNAHSTSPNEKKISGESITPNANGKAHQQRKLAAIDNGTLEMRIIEESHKKSKKEDANKKTRGKKKETKNKKNIKSPQKKKEQKTQKGKGKGTNKKNAQKKKEHRTNKGKGKGMNLFTDDSAHDELNRVNPAQINHPGTMLPTRSQLLSPSLSSHPSIIVQSNIPMRLPRETTTKVPTVIPTKNAVVPVTYHFTGAPTSSAPTASSASPSSTPTTSSELPSSPPSLSGGVPVGPPSMQPLSHAGTSNHEPTNFPTMKQTAETPSASPSLPEDVPVGRTSMKPSTHTGTINREPTNLPTMKQTAIPVSQSLSPIMALTLNPSGKPTKPIDPTSKSPTKLFSSEPSGNDAGIPTLLPNNDWLSMPTTIPASTPHTMAHTSIHPTMKEGAQEPSSRPSTLDVASSPIPALFDGFYIHLSLAVVEKSDANEGAGRPGRTSPLHSSNMDITMLKCIEDALLKSLESIIESAAGYHVGSPRNLARGGTTLHSDTVSLYHKKARELVKLNHVVEQVTVADIIKTGATNNPMLIMWLAFTIKYIIHDCFPAGVTGDQHNRNMKPNGASQANNDEELGSQKAGLCDSFIEDCVDELVLNNIANGNLLQLLREYEPLIIAVSEVGMENDANLDLNGPLVIPTENKGSKGFQPLSPEPFDVIRVVGIFLFVITLGVTIMIIFAALKKKQERITREWNANISTDSDLEELLARSTILAPQPHLGIGRSQGRQCATPVLLDDVCDDSIKGQC